MPDLSGCRGTKRGVKCSKRPVLVHVTMRPIISNSVDNNRVAVAAGDDPIVIDVGNVVIRIAGIVEGGEGSALQQETVEREAAVQVPAANFASIVDPFGKRVSSARHVDRREGAFRQQKSVKDAAGVNPFAYDASRLVNSKRRSRSRARIIERSVSCASESEPVLVGQ